MSNPFIGFDSFEKQDREHPYGEDSHLDSDSLLERHGDVDTEEFFDEPDDYDDIEDQVPQVSLPKNIRRAVDEREYASEFETVDDYEYEPELNTAQRKEMSETEVSDAQLGDVESQVTLPKNISRALEERTPEYAEPYDDDDYVYEPELNTAQRRELRETEESSENLSADDFVKALGSYIEIMEKNRKYTPEESREAFDRMYEKEQRQRDFDADNRQRRERGKPEKSPTHVDRSVKFRDLETKQGDSPNTDKYFKPKGKEGSREMAEAIDDYNRTGVKSGEKLPYSHVEEWDKKQELEKSYNPFVGFD